VPCSEVRTIDCFLVIQQTTALSDQTDKFMQVRQIL